MSLLDVPVIFSPAGVRQSEQCLLTATGLLSHIRERMDEGGTPVVSIVGAGGKTHTLNRLNRELTWLGMGHFLMTTTHVAMPAVLPVHDRLTEGMGQNGGWWMGRPSRERPGKLSPPSEAVMGQVCAMGRPVIIEADGARQKACKVPAEWEPVIRPETTCVIGVMGLSAIGKPIREGCHRPEAVSRFLGKAETDILTWQDMRRIIESPEGLFKSAKDREKIVILNQADSPRERRAGAKIGECMACAGLPVWMTSYTG